MTDRRLANAAALALLSFGAGCSLLTSYTGFTDSDCTTSETICDALCTDLTSDAKSCGTCGHDCLGGTCKDSVCQPVTLADNHDAPQQIGVNASGVYWTAGVSQSIMKVSLDGGTPFQVVSGLGTPYGIAVNAGALFWTDLGPAAGTGSVEGITLSGGGGPYKFGIDLKLPTAIALDPSFIYWTDGGSETKNGKSENDGDVMAEPIAGGTPTTLTATGSPAAIVVDSEFVYWSDWYTMSIVKRSLSGGSPSVVAAGQDYVNGMAIDSKNLYWATINGMIMSAAKAGGSAEVFASGEGEPASVAVDAANLYWVDSTSGTVRKRALAGGKPATIASGQNCPVQVVVDEKAVYWLDSCYDDKNGTVQKLAK